MADAEPEVDDPELTFYTTNQVAAMMEVTAQTVRNWYRSGELRGLMMNNRLRIRKSDLMTFIESKYGENNG